ncbi:MAG TPA: precorrin-6Y C5,15-methyltransferase (decarboxylating) subunit CbiT [Clostridia bacterium]|nr:precorrin-6Y C5,15-methyltransferase (decarboxylating) subunit CbiT [Clostridia bacterium]
MIPHDRKTLAPGIPDECFIRGPVPMTKEEIRTVALAKGKLFPGAVVYDLGSGTGSIAIEAALLACRGQVFAYEKNPAAVALIEQNKERFGVSNLQVIPAEAPDGLEHLPLAHTVFIGGSGGRLEEILQKSLTQLHPGGRIVMDAITVETLATGLGFAKAHGLRAEAVTVSVSRLEEIGSYHMWKALNPVHIITLTLEV